MNPRAQRIDQALDIPMLVVATLVIPVLVIEGSDSSDTVSAIGTALNWFVWLAFLGEAVVMLAVVSDRRAWLARHPIEVAVLLLTPPFLPASLAAARLLRLLRLIRLLRLAQAVRDVSASDGLRYVSVLAVLGILGGGAAFSAAEDGVSQWDGVWWAITTMTTVGYGDIYPHTDGGRAIAIAVMLVGIGFLTTLVGAIAQRFLAPGITEVETDEAEILAELRALHARLDRIERRLDDRS